jgi:hypothetical protein
MKPGDSLYLGNFDSNWVTGEAEIYFPPPGGTGQIAVPYS